jgi:NAD(P)-dependent dehydrogenase (short-subunit alcohol dehydrogenase family)
MRIIVTGAASGLGKAIVKELTILGHDVVQIDLIWDQDVTDPNASMNVAGMGGVDVLINCAGINANDWFEDVTEEQLFHVMDVNAFSIVKMTRLYLDKLKASKGTVINIVSNAASIPMTSSLAYNASKAAALMISKQMAHELTPKYGITVFSVSPNKLAGTGMSKAIEENVQRVRGWTPEFAAEYQKKALMHGLETEPEAVAEMIGHLISSGNMQYFSGCDIPFGK